MVSLASKERAERQFPDWEIVGTAGQYIIARQHCSYRLLDVEPVNDGWVKYRAITPDQAGLLLGN